MIPTPFHPCRYRRWIRSWIRPWIRPWIRRARAGAVVLAALAGFLACSKGARPAPEHELLPVRNVIEDLRWLRLVPFLNGASTFQRHMVGGAPTELASAAGDDGRLSYFVEVPSAAWLKYGAAVADDAPPGSYEFKVEIEPRDGRSSGPAAGNHNRTDIGTSSGNPDKADLKPETRTLLDVRIRHDDGGTDGRRNGFVDLSPYAGSVVRLHLYNGAAPSKPRDGAPGSGWEVLLLQQETASAPGQVAGSAPSTAPDARNAGASAGAGSPTAGPAHGAGGALPPRDPALEARIADIRGAMEGCNIVIVLLDAARPDRMGYYGYGRRTTPNIDALARAGVCFERAYCQAVYTLASTGTLMTGLFPPAHGATEKNVLRDRIPTLPEYLKSAGFATGSFVANHNAGALFGFDRGFDTFEHVNYDPVTQQRLQTVSTPEQFPPRLFPWIEKHRRGRFFLYVHVLQPHMPYKFPAEFRRALVQKQLRLKWSVPLVRDINRGAVEIAPRQVMYLHELYDATLAYADRFVGELASEIRRQGLQSRTIILVLGDHGEALFEHGKVGHNNTLYEETARIPVILSLPEGAPSMLTGLSVAEPVGTFDITPTLLDLARLPIPPMLPGESLLPAMAQRTLSGPGSSAPALPFRYLVSQTSGENEAVSFTTEREKLMVFHTGKCKVFDLAADPEERNDLFQSDRFSWSLKAQEAIAWYGRKTGPLGLQKGGREAVLDAGALEELKALGYAN